MKSLSSIKDFKAIAVFLTAMIVLILLSLLSNQKDRNAIKAVNGLLTLDDKSEEYSGPHKLRGEWEFYWSRLLTPDELSTGSYRDNREYAVVPRVWNHYKFPPTPLPARGYATYRLKIKIPGNMNAPALYFHEINSAHKLFVNGKLLKSQGTVSANPEERKCGTVPYIVSFPCPQNEAEIVLQISNQHHRFGGLRKDIIFGEYAELALLRDKNLFGNLFFFCCLLIIALYHSGIFLFRSKERSHIFFAVSCLIAALRSLVLGEIFLIQLFPQVGWANSLRIDYLTFAGIVPLFSLFLKTVFPDEYNRFVITIVNIVSAFYALIAVTTPLYTSSLFLPFYQLFTLILCLYTYVVLIKAVRNGRYGALLTLLCVIFISLTVLNDGLTYNSFLSSGHFSSMGLFIFALSQAYFLSIRYTTAFKTVEHLTHNLQIEVEKKTRKLEWQTEEALKAKMEVEKLSRQRTNFFMNLTHETKTPVTLIKNFLALYIEKKGSSNELDIVYRNACELERNMDNYMQLEKAFNSEKNITNHNEVCCLSELIKSLPPLFPPDLLSLSIEERVYIRANPTALRRVLDNIIINSLKHNPDRVKLSISLKTEREKVVLEIADNGIGIAPEEQENIFTPFYQLSQNKKNSQGVGLGLSLVKSIVDSLEGTIKLESSPNRGVKFIITLNSYRLEENLPLPLTSTVKSEPLPIIPTFKKIADSPYDPLKENILLVEDKVDTQKLIKQGLQERCNIYIAENGIKALEKLEQLARENCLPRLIISDIMMDELDGLALLDILREHESYKYIPLIFLTAKSDSKDKMEGYSKGAVAYITKPFTLEILKAAVDSNLENRDLLLDDFEQSRYNEQGFKELCASYGLSELKIEILRYWIIENMSQELISQKMGRSRRMIEKHIQSIKEVTGTAKKKELKLLFKEFLL